MIGKGGGGEEEEPRCRVSHPRDPHTLSRRTGANRKLQSNCFKCGEQNYIWRTNYHFSCTVCDIEFHPSCHQNPRTITHPYHLQHPLTLIPKSQSKYYCTWCNRECRDSRFYVCSICNFSLDLSCADNLPLLTIQNPKSHQRSLLFIPRPLLNPCDACGLVNPLDPSYTCFQCNYIVHRTCIDLPRVMKITRHLHRLFHLPFRPSTDSLCRICYKPIDNKYGHYSCNRDQNCSYIVHSKCATHKNVWDGKELEWEPEEPDETEANAPFKRIKGDDLIEYFSHQDRLQLMKNYDDFRDADKQCEACTLPIDSKSFYNCVQIQCDFYLHQICANLPRKLDHALHMHPLALDASPLDDIQNFRICSACKRNSTGFRYVCTVKNSQACTYIHLDICCILVPEYFTHKSHQHPLFISTFSGYNEVFCKGCKNKFQGIHLQCSECNFALCYNCATIPTEIRYKHDEHLLSLCYGESDDDAVTVAINGGYWCEKCEEKVDPKEWFYTCDKCCITIHHQCLFHSSDAFMKSGSSFVNNYGKVNVFANNGNTRPICFKCPRSRRCASSVYYKFDHANEIAYCSIACLDNKFS